MNHRTEIQTSLSRTFHFQGKYQSLSFPFDSIRFSSFSFFKYIDIVSFDIFDTLLERRIDPPDTIKELASKLAADNFVNHGIQIPYTPKQILELRNQVEIRLRNQTKETGFDPECSFNDIAIEVSKLISTKDTNVISYALIAGEYEAERRALSIKPGISQLLKSIKTTGKRIIAISDMYLNEHFIRNLFIELQISSCIDHIYMSSDHRLGKYTGRLFEHVLQTENISPDKIIHIGDNYKSDYEIPLKQGINAIHFSDPENIKRRNIVKVLRRLSQHNPSWKGDHLLSIAGKKTTGNFYYDYGFNRLGPIYSAFINGLCKEIATRKIDKIFFLAREGDLFQNLFERIKSQLLATDTAHSYLYISRKTVFAPAAIAGLSVDHLNLILFNPKQQGLASLARLMGIPEDRFSSIAHRFKLYSVNHPITNWSKSHVEEFLRDPELNAIISEKAKESHAILRKYLAQEGFFDSKRVALVDIGWSGTIQHFIQKAYNRESDFPYLTGFYLSFSNELQYKFTMEQAVGILYDSRQEPFRNNIFSQFKELFENSSRAFHGTTVGYEQHDDIIVPILKEGNTDDRLAEYQFEMHATLLRKGILDYWPDFNDGLFLTGYTYSEYKPGILKHAEHTVIYPSRNEAETFLQIQHSEDLGSSDIMKFDKYKPKKYLALYNPFKFYKILKMSSWKYGTLMTAGIPFINVIFRQLQLINRSRGKYISSPPPTYYRLQKWHEKLILFLVWHGAYNLLDRIAIFLVKLKILKLQ